MGRIISLLLAIAPTVFAQEVYYCVQLASSKKLEGMDKLFEKVQDMPDPRVELIEGLYTLRVGYFSSLEEAKEVYRKLREEKPFPDAFLRRCAYKPERVVIGPTQFQGDGEVLKLILSSLIGAGKLDKAIQLAKRGTQMYPRDPYWWETYAKLLLWTGNSSMALEPTLKAYELSGKRELLQQAYSLAVAFGRYDIAKKLMDKLDLPPEEREAIYLGTGDVEGLINFLRSRGDRKSLFSLAQILFALGRKEEALETLQKIEDRFGLSPQEVLLKANVLYSQRRFTEALKAMKEHMNEVPSEEEDFWSTLSDLSWMLSDYDTAKVASLKLIRSGRGRPGDYYRAIDLIEVENPDGALKLALEAWEKFNLLPFLEKAVLIAYGKEDWDTVIRLVESAPNLKEREYLLIYYAEALLKRGYKDRAFSTVEKILRKKPSDTLLSQYIYLLMDHKNHRRLKKVIRKYKNFRRRIPLPFIYAYLFLQKGKEAYELYKEAKIENNILKADILYLLGKEEESRNLKFKEYKRMKKKIEEDPSLLGEPEFLRDFLYIAMDFTKADRFEKLLQEAKDILPQEVWRDIYLSFLFKENRYDRIVRLARFERFKLRPWMKLNLYLHLDDRTAMEDILQEEDFILPTRDRVEALRRTKNFKKALWFAYLGLEENPEDYLLYKQKRDLVVETEDRFSAKTSYLSRKGYSELRTDSELLIKNLYDGLGLGFRLSLMGPLSKESDVLRKTPAGYKVGTFLEKEFQNSRLRFDLGVFNRLNPVLYSHLSYDLFELKRTSFKIEFGYNSEAEETLYLYLGGVKDFFRLTTVHNLTNRNFLLFEGEKSFFYSQNRTKLGEGLLLTASWNHKLRVSYPDYSFKVYLQSGNFSSTGKEGNVREILPGPGYRLVPESYTSVGVGFYFGYDNRDSYTRVWRPFMNIDLGYNTRYGSLIDLSGGVGGQVLDKDNLYLEGSFGQNMGGVQETIIRLNLGYNRWF